MTDRKRIYLACPYTSTDYATMEYRFAKVNQVAAKILNRGHIVFSPISHSHPIAVCSALPRSFEFWKDFDESFIQWADELWVLRLQGWALSDGVRREIKLAKQLDKSVYYYDPEAFND